MAVWNRERLTLVVEDEALRLMGVRGGTVSRWGSAPLPRHTLAPNGAIENEDAFVEVVDTLWRTQSEASLTPRSGIVVAIPAQGVPWATAPLSAPLPAQDTLVERASALLPVPDGGSRLWQAAGPSNAPHLFVVAPPPLLIESYQRALDRAGMGLAALDLKPLALVRGVGQRHAVIVDGERTQGTLILVEDAVPQWIESTPLTAPLLTTPEEKVARLVERLHALLHRQGARPIHPGVPIFLTGALSEHPMLREAISDVVGRSVGRFTPTVTLPSDLPASQFIANVGLAQKRV